MLAIERDKLQSRVKALEAAAPASSQGESPVGAPEGSSTGQQQRTGPPNAAKDEGSQEETKKQLAGQRTAVYSSKDKSRYPLNSPWPPSRRPNPACTGGPYRQVDPSNLQPALTVEAHEGPVTSLCFHPTLPFRAPRGTKSSKPATKHRKPLE